MVTEEIVNSVIAESVWCQCAEFMPVPDPKVCARCHKQIYYMRSPLEIEREETLQYQDLCEQLEAEIRDRVTVEG